MAQNKNQGIFDILLYYLLEKVLTLLVTGGKNRRTIWMNPCIHAPGTSRKCLWRKAFTAMGTPGTAPEERLYCRVPRPDKYTFCISAARGCTPASPVPLPGTREHTTAWNSPFSDRRPVRTGANPPEGIPGIGTVSADSAQMQFRGPLDSLRGNTCDTESLHSPAKAFEEALDPGLISFRP